MGNLIELYNSIYLRCWPAVNYSEVDIEKLAFEHAANLGTVLMKHLLTPTTQFADVISMSYPISVQTGAFDTRASRGSTKLR